MNKIIKKIIKRVLPKRIWEMLKKKKNDRMAERNRIHTIKSYEEVCAEFPGFVALNPYKKMDKSFDGKQYYSQFYQDYFLDKYIFKGKEDGFFLDIGGNDPIYINNTYFFETERHWKGLAFEPLEKMHAKWQTDRKTECLKFALGSQEKKIEFIEYEDDYMSGASDKVDYNGQIKKRQIVDVLPLRKVLSERKISHIDFMSIDVEGAELDVLEGIDFSAVNVEYIVIENNRENNKVNKIRDYLICKGYRLIARLWIDDVWEKMKD